MNPPPESTPPPHKQSFFRVVVAVLWAFLGIRKKSALEQDRAMIRPAHVIVAGIIGALLFITILVTLVRFIISR